MARAAKQPTSESGFYRVELTRSFEYGAHLYKPGAHTVDEDLLAAMKNEEGLVAHVRPTE